MLSTAQESLNKPLAELYNNNNLNNSNSNSRLIIDFIVLENFKSYAGRQIIGPFHNVIFMFLLFFKLFRALHLLSVRTDLENQMLLMRLCLF
jgi:hypothetical protein